jgi:hypothetical protein
LDIQGSIPVFIEITSGLVHDVNILDVLIPEPGSFYVMDRGYLDFERLYRIRENLGYFIIRIANFQCVAIRESPYLSIIYG